jgi:hypothetical protein
MRYGNNVLPWLQKWNIPIEKKDNKFIYISPFWAALFIPWMPDYYKEWAKIKRACSAEEYALIMWRIFVDVDPRVDAIPYLICRRTYYYRYHSIKGLEKKWVENHLTQIDDRIKQAVHFWAKVV